MNLNALERFFDRIQCRTGRAGTGDPFGKHTFEVIVVPEIDPDEY